VSDFSISTANFTGAYRGFPVEQGNDLFQAGVKAVEMGDLSSGTKAAAVSEAGDALFISSAAARMYAKQAEDEKQIHRRQSVGNDRTLYSSSAKEKMDSIDKVCGEEEKFER
jgi:hypothetical protein